MLWVSKSAVRSIERRNKRRTYRQSIELPLAIDVAGLPAPVYGTLVNISENGCRLRSLILIDRQRDVVFDLRHTGRRPLRLRGRVVTRCAPATGGGYEYGVTFTLSGTERSVIADEIREMQRREGVSRAAKRFVAKRLPQTAKQRRGSVRTLVAFPVRYRLASKPVVVAEATDVSAGGLRLICNDELDYGWAVELRFTLPGECLWAFPPAEERVEITPFGPRRIHVPDNRRPFEEMVVHGRIVSRFQPVFGRDVYGVQFTDIDGYQREEIARFVHAVQLAKLRMQ
jgi:c-di-GMP-binding flagellar brake protein YcgR